MASANGNRALRAGAELGDLSRVLYADWVTFTKRHDLLTGGQPVSLSSGVAVNAMIFDVSLHAVHPETVAVPMVRWLHIPVPFNATDGAAGSHIERVTELRVGYYRADASQVITVRLRKFDSSAGTVSDVLNYNTGAGDFATTGSWATETKSGTPLATLDRDDCYWWEVNIEADTTNTNVRIREFSYDTEKRAVE